MGKSQQVILVLLAIIQCLGYLVIGQVFQVQTDFAFQEPGERIEPADDVHDFAHNHIQSITVVRMQVPCCGGLTYAVERALQASGKQIPLRVITLSVQGDIL